MRFEKKMKDESPMEDITVQHKALLLWEENVTLNNFDYSYLYNYPKDGSNYALIKVIFPGYKVAIQFRYMTHFPYKLIVDNKRVFVCDKLRDVIKWLKEHEPTEVSGIPTGDRASE